MGVNNSSAGDKRNRKRGDSNFVVGHFLAFEIAGAQLASPIEVKSPAPRTLRHRFIIIKGSRAQEVDVDVDTILGNSRLKGVILARMFG